MKIVLINPTAQKVYLGAHPVNLAILAAYIRQWHEVVIFDTSVDADCLTRLKQINPDLVGITGTTPSINQAYACADFAKACGYKVVMGGAHVSVMPEEALRHADTVVVGEGEIAFKKIIDENLTGIVKGEPIMDLDEIPMPAYDLFDMETYLTRREERHLRHNPQDKRYVNMLTSRGCPYNCTFCHNSYRNVKHRFNSAERVVSEIEYLIKDYQIESIFFIEDNFMINKERVKQLCNLMIEREINIPWGCNSRVDNLDKDVLILAKKAGCKQITFGWESGSQKMLDIYNKQVTVKQNVESIRLCNEVGIEADGTFMVGGPTETLEDMKLTAKFIFENGISGMGVCTTCSFPGTQIWKDLEKEGKIMLSYINWKDFDFTHFPIKMFDESIDDETFYKVLFGLRGMGRTKFEGEELRLQMDAL